MLRIGIIGIGFMGSIHYYATRKVSGGQVAAICTRDQKKREGDWTGIQGNFGPRGGFEDLSHVRKYDEIDNLLADPEIDMIDICLPTHMHKPISIAALKAEKHVLVEKPISVRLDDANEMVQVAEQSERCFMVAHILPFFAEYAYAKEIVESGKYGNLIGGHFKRVISEPNWSDDFVDLEKSGGAGIDLHIHDTHYIQLLCGTPVAVFSQGKLAGRDFAQYLTTQYIYNDKELSISCSSGAVSQEGRAFSHGFELYLEKATLLYEFATLGGEPVTSTPLMLLTEDGEVHRVDLGETDPVDAFTKEIQSAVEAINQGHENSVLSGISARDALLLCHKEAESIKTGEIVPIA